MHFYSGFMSNFKTFFGVIYLEPELVLGFNLLTKTLAPENVCSFNDCIAFGVMRDLILLAATSTSDSIILKKKKL